MKDFKVLFKKGRCFNNQHLRVKVANKHNSDPTKIGVVITNKTEKSAVKRNRVKRQLRQILRLYIANIHAGFDLAITIKSSFLTSSHEEQVKAVEDILKRARVM